MTDEYYLTCIYCGKPNIHPERLYRYCTSDSCAQDAKALVFPKYPTVSVSTNEAEVLIRNSSLTKNLYSAEDKIKEQQEEIDRLKDAIVRKSTETLRYIEGEKIVARWDVIRFIVKEHQELEMHLEIMKDNPNDIDLIHRIYQEHLDLYAVGLQRLGIERCGVIGQQVDIDHAHHKAEHPQGTKGVFVTSGYYHPESDYYIKKPLVISLEEWERRSQNVS